MPFTKKVYTIADIEALPEGTRAEMIDGEMFMMASPSSQKMDWILKLAEYRKAGVREYWIVDAQAQKVTVYRFEKGDVMEVYSFEEKIPVGIYVDLELEL